MNVREMSSIHSAQNSLALWWIHKGCKITLKQYLIDVIFLFYIFCVLGFCDVYLQKMRIRPYGMSYGKSLIENKEHNTFISLCFEIYIYIVLYDSV